MTSKLRNKGRHLQLLLTAVLSHAQFCSFVIHKHCRCFHATHDVAINVCVHEDGNFYALKVIGVAHNVDVFEKLLSAAPMESNLLSKAVKIPSHSLINICLMVSGSARKPNMFSSWLYTFPRRFGRIASTRRTRNGRSLPSGPRLLL